MFDEILEVGGRRGPVVASVVYGRGFEPDFRSALGRWQYGWLKQQCDDDGGDHVPSIQTDRADPIGLS